MVAKLQAISLISLHIIHPKMKALNPKDNNNNNPKSKRNLRI